MRFKVDLAIQALSLLVFMFGAAGIAVATDPLAGDDDIRMDGPASSQILLNEVRMLRAEVIELRLDRYDERIEALGRELSGVEHEIAELEARRKEARHNLAEVNGMLTDPDLDEIGRDYLETTLEVLDVGKSGAFEDAQDRLESRERELVATLNSLKKDRKRLTAVLQALRDRHQGPLTALQRKRPGR